jgi:hypothetical protein
MTEFIEIFRKTLQAYQKNILIFDKDSIFSYMETHSEAQDSGYRLIFIESAYDFRINFELNRKSKDRLAFISRSAFTVLPDILLDTKIVNLSLHDFFPFLDSNALNGLSFSILSTLSGYKIYTPLGYNETIKFVLENIYSVDFDTLKSVSGKERLLNALITVFLEKNGVNKPISDFLSQQTKPFFPEIITTGLSKKSILEFVTLKWQFWIIENDKNIDFEEFCLAKTVGHLFIKGLIHPVKVTHEKYDSLASKIGVYYDVNQSLLDEFHSILNYLNDILPNIEDKPQEWFELIQVVSRAKLITLRCESKEIDTQFQNIETRINERFQLFVESNYNSLITRSGSKHPFIVTRILEYIRYQPNKKKALIVIDGLSYWQWLELSDALKSEIQDIEQKATFAYIPTITAWSRQAIFKGDLPDLDASNTREQKDFESFWKKYNYTENEIGFYKVGINANSDDINSDKSIVGIVINDLDEIMHGTKMGNEQLYQSTKQWVASGMLVKLILKLKQDGFKVFLTTDHGNVEAEGIKSLKMNEKFGALSRSRRHIRFSNETLKKDFLNRNSSFSIGIDGLSVYLKDKSAFVPENDKLITHGGSHFWEVIIPFIEI